MSYLSGVHGAQGTGLKQRGKLDGLIAADSRICSGDAIGLGFAQSYSSFELLRQAKAQLELFPRVSTLRQAEEQVVFPDGILWPLAYRKGSECKARLSLRLSCKPVESSHANGEVHYPRIAGEYWFSSL